MQLLDKGYITYWDSEEDNLTVGLITKVLDLNDMKTYYCIYVDSERYNELSRFGLNPDEDDLITGVFLRGKWSIRYHEVPYFITMRTADRRRPDIDEVLKRRGLKTYNQFRLLLATKGMHPTDKWRVLTEPINNITCDKTS